MPSPAPRTELGGYRHRGRDVAVVEDLVEARTQELSEAYTRPTGIGSAKGPAGVKGAVFAYRNSHVADPEPFDRNSARKCCQPVDSCG